jgi:hypothetical protein
MYKLCHTFLLLLIFTLSAAQQKNYQYSLKAGGCLLSITITPNGTTHLVSQNKIQFQIEVLNFDTSAKYFRVVDSDSGRLLVNYSDLFLANKEIDFHVGGCIENIYPKICEPRTFIFKKIMPMQKIRASYTFALKHPFAQYIKSFQIAFLIRYIEEYHLPNQLNNLDFLTLSFNDFYQYSSVIESKLNTQNRISIQE